jgi:hypothetical protein
VGEHLPSMYKALASILNITKKKKKGRKEGKKNVLRSLSLQVG